MISKEKIDRQIAALRTETRALKGGMVRRLKGMPLIRRRGERRYLCVRTRDEDGHRREHIIREQDPMYRKYLNQKYCRMMFPERAAQLEILESFSKSLRKIPRSKRMPCSMLKQVDASLLTAEDRAILWAYEDYPHNPYPIAEDQCYQDGTGHSFRSKSELLIAQILDTLQLSYRYECCYRLAGRSYYPDFTVMHPLTHELYYIEYFGIMDEPSYRDAAFGKISKYQASADAERFIYLFESHSCPMNTAAIKSMFTRIFRD